nr:MAG TPA: hypothetical protein [Caudoviricetes sp.]
MGIELIWLTLKSVDSYIKKCYNGIKKERMPVCKAIKLSKS